MNTLESQVKAALDAEADRAPTAAPWSATPRATAADDLRRALPLWALSAAAAATVATMIGLLVVASRDAPTVEDPATASQPAPPPWTPPGQEFRLEDLGPAETIGYDSIALSALTRRVGVDDHPALRVYTSLGYDAGPSAVEWQCLAVEGGGAGCSPLTLPGPFLGVTSSVNNGAADFDLWTWSNVPEEAQYVVYGQGNAARWQEPVFGVAAFPNVDWFDSVAVAYTGDGVEVGRVDPSVLDVARQQAAVQQPVLADLDQSQGSEIHDVMNGAATDCLISAGADFGGGSVGELITGDANEAWANCVAVARTAVEGWLDENDIRFYDPTTETPNAAQPVVEAVPDTDIEE